MHIRRYNVRYTIKNYVGFNSIVEEIKPNLKARGLPTQLQVPTAAQSLFTKS